MYQFCFHEKKVYAMTLCLCVMADGVPQIIFGLGPRKAIIRPCVCVCRVVCTCGTWIVAVCYVLCPSVLVIMPISLSLFVNSMSLTLTPVRLSSSPTTAVNSDQFASRQSSRKTTNCTTHYSITTDCRPSITAVLPCQQMLHSVRPFFSCL